MGWRHQPLDEVGSELREKVGGEFRRAAEDDEQAARHIFLRGRTLSDVTHELLSRGDTVQLNLGDERFVGVVIYAKGSLATVLSQNDDEVHVNLEGPIALRVTRRSTNGGRLADSLGPASFLAKLRQLEIDEDTVLLSVPVIGESIACRIEAVATDHLMAADLTDHAWYVPLDKIAAVTKRG